MHGKDAWNCFQGVCMDLPKAVVGNIVTGSSQGDYMGSFVSDVSTKCVHVASVLLG